MPWHLELARKAVRITPSKQAKNNTFIVSSEPVEVEATGEAKEAAEHAGNP